MGTASWSKRRSVGLGVPDETSTRVDEVLSVETTRSKERTEMAKRGVIEKCMLG